MLESYRIRPLLRLIRPDIATRGACRMAIDVLQDVLDTIRLHGLIAGIHTFTTDNKYNRTHAKRKLFNSVEPSEDTPPFFAVRNGVRQEKRRSRQLAPF